jgi:ribonuclease HI
MAKIANLYTDGACSGNPGPGGWGLVAYFDDGSCHELGGRDGATTNNRMEMQAAISALEYFIDTQQTEPCILYTDSEYLIKGITQWVKGWKKKGWKTAAGKAVLNQDLWEILDKLADRVKAQTKAVPISWQHVRGHAGNVGNERCDTIARGYSTGRPPQLQQRATMDTAKMPIAASPPPIDLPAPILSPPDAPEPMLEEHPIAESSEQIPREVRVAHLHHLIDTFRITRGDRWAWRNWIVSRVRREGNQILWQLERVDGESSQ